MRTWAGKQEGAVLRIAGLLHTSQHANPERVAIDATTLKGAIQIVDYFADHARIMHQLLNGHSNLENARIVLAVIRDIGHTTTKREVHRRLRGRIAFQSPKDLDEPLRVLEEFGWIRRDRTSGPQGGRPSEVIVLNPLADMDRMATT